MAYENEKGECVLCGEPILEGDGAKAGIDLFCKSCFDEGRKRCPRCLGKGEIGWDDERMRTCPKCGGSGEEIK
jgi:DnaJ-class molecular chaperone